VTEVYGALPVRDEALHNTVVETQMCESGEKEEILLITTSTRTWKRDIGRLASFQFFK